MMMAFLTATTLFFAGDSTLDDNGFRHPYRSWGRETEFSMKAGNAVGNFAQSGASTKSFLADGRWAKLIAAVKPGDFVLIEFGHNDQKKSTPFYLEKRYADPNGLFREIVRGWVREIREKGATPILVSPICRGQFEKDGVHVADGGLGAYRDAMREMSAELGCDFVDMNTLTKRLMERVGRKETEKFFVISTGLVRSKDGEPAQDVSHPIKAGAEAFAKLFIDDVKARKLSVAALFRDRDFSIADYGAKPDGSKCTAAIAATFAAAERAGGGRVVVPCGKWFTGAIRFRSNCELHLAEGAEVVFSQDPDDYLPAVHTSWEGMECWNYCPLVYAYCCTNVAISGTGLLKGYEGEWKDTKWYPWVPQTNGVKAARLQLYTWGATDHPVERREIWRMKDAHTRPHLVQFNRCRNVRWSGFRVRNSPFWTLHLYMCRDVSVRDLDVCAHGNNNDGIDVEMSRDVLIERCRFDQGDDGVVIKSGRNRDAWRLATPTENVFVRDCEIVNGHTLLGIGSEISGGVRNVLMKDCTAGSIYRVFFLKTNRRRGGFLEDIVCENVSVKSAEFSVFEIDTDVLYEWADFPDYENRATRIRNITAKNISCGTAGRRVRVAGDPKAPAEGIRIENVTVGTAAAPDVLDACGVVAGTAGLETARWQAAIDAAGRAGGGVVTIPAGRHLVGQLDLRSNVELHLEDGAVLEGAVGMENYRRTTLPYSEGTWSAVVFALGVTNVAVTGRGTIFGNGVPWETPKSGGGNQEGLRPRGLFFGDSARIRLSDFTLRDAACWGVVLKCCDGVDIRRVRVDNHANHNNDGIDIEAKNVVIADCDIDSGDDAIVLKSNDPHFAVENVLVTNVTAKSYCNCLKFGTASHGIMRNVLFVDCRTGAPRRDFEDRVHGGGSWYFNNARRNARFPGSVPGYAEASSGITVQNVDGGLVENVVYRNITVEGVRVPIFIRGGARTGRDCGTPPSEMRTLRNILIENVRGTAGSWVASSITGVRSCRVRDVTLRNVHIVCKGAGDCAAERTRPVPENEGNYPDPDIFRCMLPAWGLYARHVDGLTLENVTFELRDGETDARERLVLDDVTNFSESQAVK